MVTCIILHTQMMFLSVFSIGLSNGSLLRVIRRIKVWDYGVPKITFSEDTDKRSNISDQLRSQKVVIYMHDMIAFISDVMQVHI